MVDVFLKLKLICVCNYCVYVLQIYNLLAIALDLDSKYGEGPTYAQAMHKQGSEWFSTVNIKGGENDKEYEQLWVLFQCNVMT
jgi:hypothetical protein